MNCLCNRDNAHDVDIFPDEKITKRSEPTNQAQTKINIVKGLQTYLNDLKNYLTTYQGFKICLAGLAVNGVRLHVHTPTRTIFCLAVRSSHT